MSDQTGTKKETQTKQTPSTKQSRNSSKQTEAASAQATDKTITYA